MTEREWQQSQDVPRMLEFVAGRATARQLRLFACACVRRLWPLLWDPRCRSAVEVAEMPADAS